MRNRCLSPSTAKRFKLRDELLNGEIFYTLKDDKRGGMIADHFRLSTLQGQSATSPTGYESSLIGGPMNEGQDRLLNPKEGEDV